MTTSPSASTASPPATERVPLRITLDNSFQSGLLDGAWWPQSRDLQREAADLVDHFPYLVGQIERLLFSRPDWDAIKGAPSMRRIQAKRGTVKVGSFPSDDTHVMVMKMASGQRLRLLVIPSDTESGLASRILREAADDRNTQTPGELLGLSKADRAGIPPTTWESDANPPPV